MYTGWCIQVVGVVMRMHRRAILAALITSAFSVAQFAPAHAAGAITLRYHYKVGQQFTEVLTQHGTTKISANLVNGKTSVPFSQSSVETDKATVMVKVISIAAKGSAGGRLTLFPAPATKGGTATKGPPHTNDPEATDSPDAPALAATPVGSA